MTTVGRKTLVAKKIVIFGMVTTLAGCSIFNPHVRPSDAQSKPMLPSDVPFAGGMSDAVAYADSWRWEYYDAVGNDSELRNAIALSLIPIGAAALFFGVTGISTTDVIAGLGIGGASVYGAGSYLQSTPRQRIYLAGSQAIGCAMLAARPLLMPQGDFTALGTENQTLRFEFARVNAKADTVRAWLRQVGIEDNRDLAGPSANVANVVLETTQTLLDRGNAVYATGNKLYGQVAQAGATLHLKVDSVRDEVSRQITYTEPSLEDIKKIVGDLGRSAAEFRPVAPVAAPTAPAKPTKQLSGSESLKQLDLAVDELNKSIPALVAAINAVAARVDAAAAGNAFENVTACQVADAVPQFTVSPDVTSQALAAGSTVRFAVTGQAKQPSATLTGNVVQGVAVNVSGNGVFIAEVKAESNTPGGTTQLLIQDGTTTKAIDIVVQKATPTAPQSQTEQIPATATVSEWEKASSKEQRINVQKALNLERNSANAGELLEEDGAFGTETRKAIREYQGRQLLDPTGEVNEALYERLLSLLPAAAQTPAEESQVTEESGTEEPQQVTESSGIQDEALDITPAVSPQGCVTGPADAYERSLTPKTIAKVQEALGMTVDQQSGILDSKTREFVFETNRRAAPPPANLCLLTDNLVTFLTGE